MFLQETLFNQPIVKSNRLIRAQMSRIPTDAGRIFAALVSKVDAKAEELRAEYDLRTDDYGFSNLVKKGEIKRLVKDILSASFWLEEGRPKDPDYRCAGMNLVSKIEYHKGIITAKFSSDIRDFIVGLQANFTQFALGYYLKLSSYYSQRLYEYLKSLRGTGIQHREVVIIELKDLFFTLNVPTKWQKRFSDFEKDVLSKCVKDICTKTDLMFSYQKISPTKCHALKVFFGDTGQMHKLQQQDFRSAHKKLIDAQRLSLAVLCAEEHHRICDGKPSSSQVKPIICRLCRKRKVCDVYRQTPKENEKKEPGLFDDEQ